MAVGLGRNLHIFLLSLKFIRGGCFPTPLWRRRLCRPPPPRFSPPGFRSPPYRGVPGFSAELCRLTADALMPSFRTAAATGAPAVLVVSVNTLSRAAGGVCRLTAELCRPAAELCRPTGEHSRLTGEHSRPAGELSRLSLAPPYGAKAVILPE
jgi:hypothetical protein